MEFMRFDGDIIITDPCYIINDDNTAKRDDWELCEYGEDMSLIGIENCVTSDTGCGDWSCMVFEEGSNRKLGEFCADSGMVGVFLLDDVLKYNPKFDYHIENPYTTTLIKGFHGEVDIVMNEDGEAEVIGEGNVNFKSRQTGF